MKRIWINGTFDILHYGHFKLINYAKTLGDYIVIGIDSDRRVKEFKGDDRPYHNEKQRLYNLLSLKSVSKVVLFDTDDELRYHIRNENVDIMVIGSDYRNKPIIGSEYIPNIIYFDRINNFSTTDIINGKSNN
jgi:D-beta-D-heptose 7-phosphate kinase/D-beta-D-heptose 1-phosphate adenosyltransferase